MVRTEALAVKYRCLKKGSTLNLYLETEDGLYVVPN